MNVRLPRIEKNDVLHKRSLYMHRQAMRVPTVSTSKKAQPRDRREVRLAQQQQQRRWQRRRREPERSRCYGSSGVMTCEQISNPLRRRRPPPPPLQPLSLARAHVVPWFNMLCTHENANGRARSQQNTSECSRDNGKAPPPSPRFTFFLSLSLSLAQPCALAWVICRYTHYTCKVHMRVCAARS